MFAFNWVYYRIGLMFINNDIFFSDKNRIKAC